MGSNNIFFLSIFALVIVLLSKMFIRTHLDGGVRVNRNGKYWWSSLTKDTIIHHGTFEPLPSEYVESIRFA